MPIASACKPCENGDGLALRLWNPTSTDWHGVLASDLVLCIEPCDLLERPTNQSPTGQSPNGKHQPSLGGDGTVGNGETVEAGNVEICVPAGGIATFTMR